MSYEMNEMISMNPGRPQVRHLLAQALLVGDEESQAQMVADTMMTAMIMAEVIGIDTEDIKQMIQAGHANAVKAARAMQESGI